MAAAAAPELTTFASLPHALARRISVVLLPADVRMRCAEVCPGWSTVLKDTSLWLRLDFSSARRRPPLASSAPSRYGAAVLA
jgi:hypothetical protein